MRNLIRFYRYKNPPVQGPRGAYIVSPQCFPKRVVIIDDVYLLSKCFVKRETSLEESGDRIINQHWTSCRALLRKML